MGSIRIFGEYEFFLLICFGEVNGFGALGGEFLWLWLLLWMQSIAGGETKYMSWRNSNHG